MNDRPPLSERRVEELVKRLDSLESLVTELMLNGAARQVAAPVAPVAHDSPKSVAAGGRFLVLRVGERLFGLPLSCVREVVRNVALEPVPGALRALAGLLDLRGRPVEVIDLRAAFGEPPLEVDLDSRIVVIEWESRAHGFLVDEAVELAEIDGARVEPPPRNATASVLSGLVRLRERLVLLLDVGAVVAGVARDEALPVQVIDDTSGQVATVDTPSA